MGHVQLVCSSWGVETVEFGSLQLGVEHILSLHEALGVISRKPLSNKLVSKENYVNFKAYYKRATDSKFWYIIQSYQDYLLIKTVQWTNSNYL